MKSSSVVLALAAGSSAAIVARDAATVLADISSIDSQVKALVPAINSFTSLATSGPLITAEGTLDTAIKKGTSDAQATTGPVSVADTNSILSAVAALIPDIVTALQAIVDKAPTFSSSGAASIVTMDLNQLQTDTDAFANALIAIAPSAAGDSANAAKSCIDAAFASALATQSVNGACASGVTTIGGGGATSSAPASSAPATSSAPASSAPATSTGSSAPTSSGSSAPTSTAYASTSASGYPSGTGVGPTPSTTIPFSNGAGAVKVGITGVVAMAVFALFM